MLNLSLLLAQGLLPLAVLYLMKRIVDVVADERAGRLGLHS